ncbi:MAG: ABC transporter transmembrane domain-containing protein, partial [Chloroflexia bacterium]
DICWQLQARGWRIGFNPAAMVYHHRRNSVRAYWRQQVGYGEAEALLEKKWPEKYNSAGHVRWAGRLYGDGLMQTLWASRGRVYGGVWGSAPFQSVYGPEVNGLLALTAMPEWYFLSGLLLLMCVLGIFWAPLLWALPLLVVSVATLLVQAILGGARARLVSNSSRASSVALRAITSTLHLIQPLARLIGRLSQGLTPWRRQGAVSVALALPLPSTLAVWREEWQAPEAWLKGVEGEIKSAGGAVERGGNYDRWDLHVRGGLLGAARMRMGVEEHGGGRQLARFRLWPRFRPVATGLVLIFAGLAVWAGGSGAWVAAVGLGFVGAAFAGRVLYECAASLGTLRMGVRATEGVQLDATGKKPGPTGPYRILLPYVSKYWRGWLLILALTLLSTGLTLLQPWPLKVLVDNVLSAQPLSGVAGQIAAPLPGMDNREGLLIWVVAGGVILFLCTSGIDMLLTYHWVRVGQGMVYGLARDLFARIQRRSLVAHSRSAVGDSLSRITTDAWVVHTAADNLLFAPAHAAITAVSVLAVMLTMNSLLTLLSLAVTPLLVLTSVLLGSQIKVASRARRRIESQLQAHVHRIVSGIQVVQAFTRERHERDRLTEFARRSIEAQQRSALASNLYNLGSGLTLALGMALILWIGAGEVLGGRLTVGSLLVFVAYLGVLQSQLKTFVGITRTMQEATGSAERVAEILNTRDDIQSKPGAPPLGAVRGGIRLRNVTFGYEPERPVLKDLSIQIEPGQMVAIVGATGGGKSTLAGLIARLYDPWEGTVEIDEQDVRDVELGSLREAVGLALQEPYLFAATVADNIGYGKPSATEGEVEAAAAAVGANTFIRQLPQGYDTLLGERGGTLSGGEQQRLSIARALIKNAPILVLDEPTSALDAETEQMLVNALRRVRAGKTTVIIAHRLSTVRHADRIIVIEDGVVEEEGSHDELMARRGVYRHLYGVQSSAQLATRGMHR